LGKAYTYLRCREFRMGRAVLGSTAGSDGQALSLHERFSRLSSVRYPAPKRVVTDAAARPQLVVREPVPFDASSLDSLLLKRALLLGGAVAGRSLGRGARGGLRPRTKMYYNGGNFNTVSGTAFDPHVNPYFVSSSSSCSPAPAFLPSPPPTNLASFHLAPSTFGSPRGRGRGRGGFRGRGRGRGSSIPEMGNKDQISEFTREQLDADMDQYFLEPQVRGSSNRASDSGQPVLTGAPRTKRLKSQL